MVAGAAGAFCVALFWLFALAINRLVPNSAIDPVGVWSRACWLRSPSTERCVEADGRLPAGSVFPVTRTVTAIRLLRVPEPFGHPDWTFEPKMDGFRALAHVNGHHCTLISRNGHTFKSWPQLAEEIAHSVGAQSAILDRGICCPQP